jgi:hypothetical protein
LGISDPVALARAWQAISQTEITMSDTEKLWTIVALAAVAIIFITLIVGRRRARARSEELQRRFGPEYEHAVEELGSPKRAERELEQRARRVEHFRFNDLSAAARESFAAKWNEIQGRFVDDPAVAVTAANELINEVMRARGYPTLSFDQRVADLSVEHPTVVQHYRAAHELSRSVFNGNVDTEQLRQALVHYRMLFTDLLHESRQVSAPPAPLRHVRAS